MPISNLIYRCQCFFGGVIRKIPLLSGLPDISSGDLYESFKETFTTVVISTIPIWLGAIIVSLIKGGITLDGFVSGFFELTKNGELILYASSLLAPVVWIMIWDKPNDVRFPSKMSHLLVVIVLLLVSAVFYAFTLQAGVEGKPDEPIKNVHAFSVSMFLISIFVLLVAQAYRNNRVNPVEEYVKQEKSFQGGYRRNRGES